MDAKKLNRTDKTAVVECMELLARTIIRMDTKTDALLYFQFEDLLNRDYDIKINNSDRGEVIEDGEKILTRWDIARGEYLETMKITESD